MSTPPQDSIPDIRSHTTTISLGPAHTTLSSPGQASSLVENASELPALTTALDTPQTSHPRPTSSSSNQATLVSKPIPELPREHIADAAVPSDVRQRVASLTFQAPIPVSTHEGGRARANTPPRKGGRVTRSDPRPDEATHARGSIIPPPGDLYRRSSGRYADSETAWYAHSEREPFHERNVTQRLATTVNVAKEELAKSTKRVTWIVWAQNVAITLEILIGALTTALGAALSGKHTAVAIATLGVSSTLVASYLARTRGSNEPHKSRLRVRELKRLLREIDSFTLDHGYDIGDKWDDQINGFRLSLEIILGNRPRGFTRDADSDIDTGEEKGERSVDRTASSSGNGKRPVTTKKVKSEHLDA